MDSTELPNDFNLVKVGRTVTFMKYLASVVSLLFLAKILIWNKITIDPVIKFVEFYRAGS